jgi:transcriptional regulator with XRE-family HTH domain
MTTYKKLKEKALSHPKVKQHYDELRDEFDWLKTFIQARQKAQKSQEDMAKLMGTSTSVIGRLESSGGKTYHSPTLATLQRYAKALHQKIVIKLVPER